MDEAAIEQAAELLCRARLEHRPIGPLPAAYRPPDQAAAYAVQERLHEKLLAAGRGPLAGYKIGCTTPVMQRFLDIPNPCAGGVLAPTVARGEGQFRHGDFLHVGVECEIAVRLGRDLPPSDRPHDRDSVGVAVQACMAAIEVVDDRYVDYRALDTPTLIADDFFNAACVLGSPVVAWHDIDLGALTGRMTINGREVGRGRGADILGQPFEALAWLANALVDRGQRLRAGEIVLLGSLVETRWVTPGDRVEINIDHLGLAACTFF